MFEDGLAANEAFEKPRYQVARNGLLGIYIDGKIVIRKSAELRTGHPKNVCILKGF